MTNLRSIFNQVFAFIAVLVLTTLSISNVSAHTTDAVFTQNLTDIQSAMDSDFADAASPFAPLSPNFYSPEAMGIKIKIIIIIIIKKKKKGVVEVVGTRIAEQGLKTQLKENEVLAEATRDGKEFFIMPLKGVHANSEYGFPPSFKLSKDVSLKLGSERPLGLKAIRVEMNVNKMGNFEIQD
ncbi:MAG: hypothetical protein R3E32_02705 [Chitinophagales bacterium]